MTKRRESVPGNGVAVESDRDPAELADEGTRAVNSLSEVEEFFGAAKGQYNAQGIMNTSPDIVELNWLTPRIVLAEVPCRTSTREAKK